MAVITIGRIAEECKRLIEGGGDGVASGISLNELKISIGQVINQLLKIDYLSVNVKLLGEAIPNGSVLGLYEDIDVVSWNGKSKATLPIKPLKLPRNMGVFAVYMKKKANDNYDIENELIPLQMGQFGLLKSQAMISDLLGAVGYECFGNDLIFTKDLKQLFPEIKLAMRLVIMDISQYGDFDLLPVLPEQEWLIKQEVVKMYSQEPIPDKLVDSSAKENKGVPLNQQKQS